MILHSGNFFLRSERIKIFLREKGKEFFPLAFKRPLDFVLMIFTSRQKPIDFPSWRVPLHRDQMYIPNHTVAEALKT